MKIRSAYVIPAVALILALVAWSPPNSENLIVGPTTGETANSLTSPGGQAGLVGVSNKIRATDSFIVGLGNTNYDGGVVNTSNKISRSLVVGYGNIQAGDRANCVLSGSGNTLNANNTLVSGTNNNVASVTSNAINNSCAIGGNNIITSPHAYAVGYNNTMTGDYGHALGYDLEVTQYKSTAVGRYNAVMSTGDVFVVGTGSSVSARNTALRATSDGSVILGSATSGAVVLAKAQGDISMGAYSN